MLDTAGATASHQVTITVADLPPAVSPVAPAIVGVGLPDTLLASFADAGTLDTHVAAIDWGDGTPAEPATLVEQGGSGAISATHAYARPGVYTARIAVEDDGGLVGLGQVAIAAVAPANPSLYVVPGAQGSTTEVAFTLKGRHAVFQNSGGIYVVQDADARVAGLLPGQAGYARAALTAAGTRVLFPEGRRSARWSGSPCGRDVAGPVPGLELHPGLRPRPQPGRPGPPEPIRLLPFAAANPDHIRHDRITVKGGVTTIGTEDRLHGFDRDFNDQVMTIAVAGASTAAGAGLVRAASRGEPGSGPGRTRRRHRRRRVEPCGNGGRFFAGSGLLGRRARHDGRRYDRRHHPERRPGRRARRLGRPFDARRRDVELRRHLRPDVVRPVERDALTPT